MPHFHRRQFLKIAGAIGMAGLFKTSAAEDFPQISRGSAMHSSLPLDDLKRFLTAAKRATYASQGDTATVKPLLPDSKQLEYSDGQLFYRDIYVGMFRFVGQEIVYQADRAIWSMSYSGGLSKDIPQDSANAVYELLRKALLALPPEIPIRGPSFFEEGKMRYICKCSGSIEQFHGIENVAEGHTRLYELTFAGGLLSPPF